MAFFKHVGEHNNKKVIIVQRQLPGEEHMAAVIYSQIIPSRYHDDVMHLLQSEEGQQSKEFMDIMNRRVLSNGNNMLVSLVNEGFIKKAPSNQIIVRPNASSAIRLDELVKLLKMAGEGQEAVRKLEELDRQQGRKDPIKINAPMPAAAGGNLQAPSNGILDDNSIADGMRGQANKMRADANALIAEAARLEKEANDIAPLRSAEKVQKRRGRKPKTESQPA